MHPASKDQTIARVIDLVSHLDGPACSPNELQWVADIPAGILLLEWLASQTLTSDYPATLPMVVGREHYEEDSRNLKSGTFMAAVSPIAIYKSEIDTLASLQSSRDGTAATAHEGEATVFSARYELPSRLRARTAVAESEAELLEKHAALLKHRLHASKAAAKELRHAIHALRKQLQASENTISEQHQRLTELSAQTDSEIARHTNIALRALQDAVPASQGSDTLDNYKTSIAQLSIARASVSSAATQLYQVLDDGYASLPAAKELQHDASVVQAKLREATRGLDVEKLADTAYAEVLERIATRIENAHGEHGAEEIARILREVQENDGSEKTGTVRSADGGKVDVDVKHELDCAGRADRLALLQAQERGLDVIIGHMRTELMPRLKKTHDILHNHSTLVVETEAIVSSLIEELEDVNDAVESTKNPITSALLSKDKEDPEELVEREIIDLLKEMLADQGDGGRLTVLLNRTDVKKELSALSQRDLASQKAEEKWVSDLRGRLSELSSSTTPLLSAVYANSPVNTSPPFAPDAAQIALYESTCAKAGELIDAATRLQEEIELSTRDKRKLGAFVDKWIFQ
ncbi:hypothetical protein C8Q74DRAFT_1203828 [Fomes fomentarius]|nr:hypothetical protein C8Q74DRAFT_1203828 [Fomes fomentarius]